MDFMHKHNVLHFFLLDLTYLQWVAKVSRVYNLVFPDGKHEYQPLKNSDR